jgi:hypothetical protein
VTDSLDFGVRISLILDDIEEQQFDTIPWHLYKLYYHSGSTAPDLSTLFNQNKTEILKEILMAVKDPEIYEFDQEHLEAMIDGLKLLRVDWPEIAIIEKSIAAGIPGPLNEVSMPPYYLDQFRNFDRNAFYNYDHGWRVHGDLKPYTDLVVRWVDRLWRTERFLNDNPAYYAVNRLITGNEQEYWISVLRPVMDNHKTDIMTYLLQQVKRSAFFYAARDMQTFLKLGVDWPEMLLLKDWLYQNGNDNVKQRLTKLDESDSYHIANIKKYISRWPAIETVCEIANRLNYGQIELEEIKPIVEQNKELLIIGILKAIREGDTGDALYATHILTSLLKVNWSDLKVIQQSLIKDAYS